MSKDSQAKDDNIDLNDENITQGAACLEIINESSEACHEMLESDIEGIGTCSTFQTMLRDLHPSSRRFSTFLSPNDTYHSPGYLRSQRHASLPFILTETNRDYKKLMFESSRRSSFESAYHSQRSEPTSRTDSNSQLDGLEDFSNFQEEHYYLGITPLGNNENLESEINERRNSLSYEAIRTYFLERNPYIHGVEQFNQCVDHRNLSSTFCQHCRRRRSSVVLPYPQFRTNAHQAVIERQFEDLSNIPDFTYSRSTSIDLFGGIGIPFNIEEITHKEDNELYRNNIPQERGDENSSDKET